MLTLLTGQQQSKTDGNYPTDGSSGSRTLPDFLNLLREYKKRVEIQQETLLFLLDMAAIADRIWPDQYQRILTHLRPTYDIVEDICDLLRSQDTLPDAIIPLRYELLVTAHCLKSHLNSVYSMSDKIQSPSHKGPISSKIQSDIASKLRDILKYSGQIQQEISLLMDKSRFQDRLLTLSGSEGA